jgi:hypothetical protein
VSGAGAVLVLVLALVAYILWGCLGLLWWLSVPLAVAFGDLDSHKSKKHVAVIWHARLTPVQPLTCSILHRADALHLPPPPAAPAVFTFNTSSSGAVYTLNQTAADFATAERNCQAAGGHLVSYTSVRDRCCIRQPPESCWQH